MRYGRIAAVKAALVLGSASSLVSGGCALPPSRAAKVQEAAAELNVNARFNRMGLVLERVADKERDAFLKRHRHWGEGIRIAEADLAGMRLVSDKEADVAVRVAWYRVQEQELRVTTIRQRYAEVSGSWLLVGESQVEGDPGLLGDDVVEAPPTQAPAAQFPTIRIRGE